MHPSALGVEELDGVPQPDLGGYRAEQGFCMLRNAPGSRPRFPLGFRSTANRVDELRGERETGGFRFRDDLGGRERVRLGADVVGLRLLLGGLGFGHIHTPSHEEARVGFGGAGTVAQTARLYEIRREPLGIRKLRKRASSVFTRHALQGPAPCGKLTDSRGGNGR